MAGLLANCPLSPKVRLHPLFYGIYNEEEEANMLGSEFTVADAPKSVGFVFVLIADFSCGSAASKRQIEVAKNN